MKTFEKDGFYWPEGTSDKAISCHLYRTVSMKEAVSLLPKAHRRTCVQAGGSHGIWPAYLAKQFKRVFTFEPDAISFNALVQNVQATNVFKMQAALGKTIGIKTLQRKGESSHRITEDKGLPVVVLRLDSFLIDDVDALLLDVEGYEPEVLRGALGTIAASRPVILIEYNPREHGTGIEAEKIILEAGYTFYKHVQSDRIYTPNEMKIKEA